MDKNIDAVVDAARCYAAVARSVDADTPPALLEIVARRRRALIRAVDRLEGQANK